MQDNLYDILSKHFFSQTTEEEEQLIKDYRTDHPEEYARLKTMFQSKKINTKYFDSHKAWDKVISKYESKKTTVIPRYQKLSIAAAVILMIVSISLLYVLIPSSSDNAQLSTISGATQQKVLLPDSTVIWLNKDAQLSYPKAFAGDSRIVHLTGEAFFEVSRDPDKPFIINANTTEVKVLGTSFNVKAEMETTEVSVTTGTVQVLSKASNNQVIIQAGFSALVSEGSVNSFETTNPNYQSWHTGIFSFNEVELEVVIKELNTYYTQDIQLNGQPNCAISAKIENQSLTEVLEILKLICSISVEETPTGYKISNQ